MTNTRNSLTHNNAESYFNAIIGYEEVDFLKQKPDPGVLLKCSTHLGLHTMSGTILFIGDYQTDAHCAFNINHSLGWERIVSIGASY